MLLALKWRWPFAGEAREMWMKTVDKLTPTEPSSMKRTRALLKVGRVY
jgi:hypothetical protein